MQAAEQSTAETLLTAFRTIKAPERQKHATVLDYWLSIRGDKEFPPLHDLDPLEISDAGPSSILLELIGGGQDAEIRHLGEALVSEVNVSRIIDALQPVASVQYRPETADRFHLARIHRVRRQFHHIGRI